MVEKGYFKTVNEAKRIIMAGHVLIDDIVIDKPGTNCKKNVRIRIKYNKKKFVSRGGDKLQAFLKKTEINIENKICLDVGISTGGFTDVLLQHNANHVLGIDVAYGLTDFKIRKNNNVSLLERTNVRYLTKHELSNTLVNNHLTIDDISIVTMDVSFISVFKILPNLIDLLHINTEYIILIKPQFEGEKHMIDKGGIVTNSNYITEILESVSTQLSTLQLTIINSGPSKIKGLKGNQEYFYHCKIDIES